MLNVCLEDSATLEISLSMREMHGRDLFLSSSAMETPRSVTLGLCTPAWNSCMEHSTPPPIPLSLA